MRFQVLFISSLLTLLFVINLPGQISGDENLFVIDSIFIPTGSQTTPGNGVFTGPLANTPRTYQLLINESELTTISGKEIKAISWRIPTSSTTAWPDADATFNNFDIYLSGSVAPVNRSLIFAQNIVGPQTQVRSGSLIIRAGSYPIGNVPNYCGPEIAFDTAYLYTGGHLLIEIHHDSSNSTSRSVEAFTTSTPNYGILYSAVWLGVYNGGTTGLAGNFSAIKLTYDDPVPVELTSFTASAQLNAVTLNWSTATESNNKGFYIERASGEEWLSLGFIEGLGTTTEEQHYSFIDKNLPPASYSYRLKQVDYDGSFEYSNTIDVLVGSPTEFMLAQNYPNPFNPSTRIEYSIPSESPVTIKIVDILGNEIETLIDGQQSPGSYEVTWNAADNSAGIYFCIMRANNFISSRKLVLLK